MLQREKSAYECVCVCVYKDDVYILQPLKAALPNTTVPQKVGKTDSTHIEPETQTAYQHTQKTLHEKVGKVSKLLLSETTLTHINIITGNTTPHHAILFVFT